MGAGSLAPTVRGGGRPLAGITVMCEGHDVPSRVASELLEHLGATVIATRDGRDVSADCDVTIGVEGAGVPVARLLGDVPDEIAGLPLGTVPYACGLATAAAAILALLSDADVEVDAREVAIAILLPAVVAAEYGTRHREPAPPRRIGGGALACDLATADDEATFTRLLGVVGRDATARAIADEAQAWRLPVCEYARHPGATAPGHDRPGRAGAPRLHSAARPDPPTETMRRPPLEGLTVCDLTAMWAGPLSTWLLAGAGATIDKIESGVRLDGMRGLDGGGIHPEGIDHTTGTASGMFNALNRQKSCHDLDLRDPADRAAFVDLVRASDLVVDSFSRRVMPNFDLSPAALRAEHPGIITLSLPAFPEDHPWQVALGPGVHAATGLGDLGGGRVAAPVVAYPDPLAGLTAFAVATALAAGARRGVPTEHAEVTLFDVTAPLARIAPPDPILRSRDPELGRRMLDDPALAAVWELVCDGAGRHRYPRQPFRGAWAPVPPTPAPAIGAGVTR